MYCELMEYCIETKDKNLLIAVKERLELLIGFLNEKIEKL